MNLLLFLINIGVYATGNHSFLSYFGLRFAFELLAILSMCIIVFTNINRLGPIITSSLWIKYFVLLSSFSVLAILAISAEKNLLYYPAVGLLCGLTIHLLSWKKLTTFVNIAAACATFFLAILLVQNVLYIMHPEQFEINMDQASEFTARERFSKLPEPKNSMQYLGNINNNYVPPRFQSYFSEPSVGIFFFMFPFLMSLLFARKSSTKIVLLTAIALSAEGSQNSTSILTIDIGILIFLAFYLTKVIFGRKVRATVIRLQTKYKILAYAIICIGLIGPLFLVRAILGNEDVLAEILGYFGSAAKVASGYGRLAGSYDYLVDGFQFIPWAGGSLSLSGVTGLVSVSYYYCGVLGLVFILVILVKLVYQLILLIIRSDQILDQLAYALTMAFVFTLFFFSSYGFSGIIVALIFVLERFLNTMCETRRIPDLGPETQRAPPGK